MKKIKENMVFVMLIVAVLLGLFVLQNDDYIMSNPLQTSFNIDMPIGCCVSDNGNRIIIDKSGSNILVTNSDMKLLYNIPANSKENGYYEAVKVETDKDNNIYVLDKIVEGSTSTGRIVKYTDKGKFDQVVYTTVEEEDAVSLLGLNIYDDSLYCVEVLENKVMSIKINVPDLIVDEIRNIDFADAGITIADVSVSPAYETACATKSGDVYLINEEMDLLYDASEDKCDDNFSLAYEVEYDDSGNLYIDDYGRRRILKLDSQNNIKTIVNTGATLKDKPDKLVDAPIYTGLYVFGDSEISVVSAEYYYDNENNDSTFNYQINIADGDGNSVYKGFEYNTNELYMVYSVLVKLALLLLIALCLYSVIRFILAARKLGSASSYKIQIITFITAVIVTFFVALIISENYNQRYVNEVVNKMENISNMTCQLISPDDIDNIDDPSDYLSDQYISLTDTINNVLYNDTNADSGLYGVVYKLINDSIWEVCSDPYYHGGLYPMPGSYEGSAEQKIYETGKPKVSYDYSSADGSYMFSLAPVKNNNDEVIGLIEIGIDLTEFTEENNKLFLNVLIYVIMGIIITVLIFGEFVNAKQSLTEMISDKKAKRKITVKMVRPIVFLIFFASNLSTAFLPIYAESLYTNTFSLPLEFAAAIPLSVEMFMAALTSLIAGRYVEKLGARLVSIAGVVLYIGGMIMSYLADSLYILIDANLLIGIGGGFVLIAINSYIAAYGDEGTRNVGFSCFNAALAAGANCGTVVGSLIAEKFGYRIVFIIGACIMVISGIVVMVGLNKLNDEKNEDDRDDTDIEPVNKISLFKFITTPRVILFIVMIMMPYLVCASFLSYFFPVYGEDNSLTEIQISMAFLISGVISIYIGPILSELAILKIGTKRSIVLASSIYALAIAYFVLNPSITNCFIVIAMFSLADSFGLTAQDVYFSGIDEVLRYGSGKAMSTKSVFENIANVFGPIVFGAALLYGIQLGMLLIGCVFVAMLLIHTLFSLYDSKRMRIGSNNK